MKNKNLLGLLTVFLLACGLLIASGAEAAAYTFSLDLKFGTSGADVIALQSSLIAEGFHIPSIESGKFAKGYFGQETLAAVRKYQTARKIPSTGFVGPLTRGALNGNVSVIAVDPGIITTLGAKGTLALSLHAAPANGTSLSKGQEADVVTYKVQAGSSDMRLNSVQIDMSTRLWLYAGSITLKDGETVIAQINNLRASHFTELTTGSNYRLTIPVNIVIAKGTAKFLTLHVVALPISDRSSATISLTRFETRAMDGAGVSDTQSLSSIRTFQYTGVNNGQIVITANPQTPPNMTAPISSAGPTDNIVLGVADFRSEMKDGIMRSLTLYMNANFDLSTAAITTLLGDIKIQSGTLIYTAESIGGVADFIPGLGVPVTFSNMQIPLPKDTLVPIAILVKVNQNTNNSLDGKAASSTVIASGTEGATDNNPYVEDAGLTTIAINTAPLVTSDITFTGSNSNVDYTAPVTAKLGTPIVISNATALYPVTFSFSITAGDNTLYVSADPNQALSTSSSGLVNNARASLPIGGTIVNPSNMPGDTNVTATTGYYVIPAGSTRSFTYNGSISNVGGTSGTKNFKITAIKYGTTTSALSANSVVYYNYDALKVNPSF